MIKDYLNNEFKNKTAMCKHYGITVKALDARLARGWDLKCALTMPSNAKKLYSYNGEYYSSADICKMAGISYSMFTNRLSSGWTIDEIVTNLSPKTAHAHDHLGNIYDNETVMCNHYGISRCTYRSRINMGWSKEEALMSKPGETFKAFTSPIVYEGKEYWSYSALQKVTGVHENTLKYGLTKGFSINDVIYYARNGIRICKEAPIRDHLGNLYPNVKYMLKQYGIPYRFYKKLSDLNISLEELIKIASEGRLKELSIKRHRKTREIYDYLGNSFVNTKEMCTAWGVSYYSYLNKTKQGTPQDEIFTCRLKLVCDSQSKSNRKPTGELIGSLNATFNCKTYNSSAKLANDMHISLPTLKKFWAMGLSNDEIASLGTKASPSKIIKGPDGNWYPSEKALCAAYKTSQKTFKKCISGGMSLEDALMYHGHSIVVSGIRYASYTDFFKRHNLPINKSMARLRKGWTTEEIVAGRKNDKFYECVDDVMFDSQKAIAEYLGCSQTALNTRICKGMTYQEACNDIRRKDNLFVRDHLGNEYKTTSDMCRHYNVKFSTFNERRKAGASIKDALTAPVKTRGCYDHHGKWYKTLPLMCEHYNISYDTYLKRKKENWELKDILEIPHVSHAMIIEYDGVIYKSLKEFCNKNNINYVNCSGWIRRGFTLEEAIEKCTRHRCDHVGETSISKCGLRLTLTEHEKGNHYYGIFEDSVVKRINYSSFKTGSYSHPTLSHLYKGTYKGFVTWPIRELISQGEFLYKCECQICGEKDVYTPWQMAEHSQKHEKGNIV